VQEGLVLEPAVMVIRILLSIMRGYAYVWLQVGCGLVLCLVRACAAGGHIP
jgi:hypothetical protein